MMFFGNNFNMNYGFGYNPFATGSFCNPNYNFFSGGYGSFIPSSYQSPLNSLFNFNSYSPYSSYTPYNSFGNYNSYGNYNSFGNYDSFGNFNSYGSYNNLYPQMNYSMSPMSYGMMPSNDFSQMLYKQPGLNNSGYSYLFNNNFSTNSIQQQKPATEDLKGKPSYKERDLDKKGDEYGPEFLKKVKEISKRLNCDYKDLLGVMNSESGINAKAQNKNGGASGLIQFMPKTAEMLGTTTDKLREMAPIDQLDYVEECIKRCKKMAGMSANQKLSGGELYALIFLPARANREVLTTSNEAYYKANKGLDANKDGKITKAELDERVARFHVSDKSFLA